MSTADCLNCIKVEAHKLTPGLACATAASQPSRHLLLGNISSRPNESALETVFGKFGPLDSVKVFPGKTYARVSFKDLAPAAEAMQCLDGHSLLSVSGQPSILLHPTQLSSMYACPTALTVCRSS